MAAHRGLGGGVCKGCMVGGIELRAESCVLEAKGGQKSEKAQSIGRCVAGQERG